MSIASEITRLQGVKSDILQAISDKGVVVPAGSALDDCPDLIASISGLGIEYLTYFSNFDTSTGIDTPVIGGPTDFKGLNTTINYSVSTEAIDYFINTSTSKLELSSNTEGHGPTGFTFSVNTSEPKLLEMVTKLSNTSHGYYIISLAGQSGSFGFASLETQPQKLFVDTTVVQSASEINIYGDSSFIGEQYGNYWYNRSSVNYYNWSRLGFLIASGIVYLLYNGRIILSFPNSDTQFTLNISPYGQSSYTNTINITQLLLRKGSFPFSST